MQVFQRMREKGMPMVIDADGLYIVTKHLDLVRGYPKAILTPNKNEYARLAAALDVDTEQARGSCPLLRLPLGSLVAPRAGVTCRCFVRMFVALCAAPIRSQLKALCALTLCVLTLFTSHLLVSAGRCALLVREQRMYGHFFAVVTAACTAVVSY